jgi:hypothetical protein
MLPTIIDICDLPVRQMTFVILDLVSERSEAQSVGNPCLGGIEV